MCLLQDKVAEVKTKIEKMTQLKKDVEYIMNEYPEEFTQKNDLIELKQKYKNLFKNQSQDDETNKENEANDIGEVQNNIGEEMDAQNEENQKYEENDDDNIDEEKDDQSEEKKDCEDDVNISEDNSVNISKDCEDEVSTSFI